MPVTIHWFRSDLRLFDNPALTVAADSGQVIPIYILEEERKKNKGQTISGLQQTHTMGAATKLWLHHALSSLHADLQGNLIFRCGNADRILKELIDETSAQQVTMTRRYAPQESERDENIRQKLQEKGVKVTIETGNLLWDPEQITKLDGTPYKVFTPFYRRGCLAANPPRQPLPRPNINFYKEKEISSLTIDKLHLKPSLNWTDGLASQWDISEYGAQAALQQFILSAEPNGLSGYAEGRNFPSRAATSRLSPYLKFGQISPHQAWYAADGHFNSSDKNLDMFRSELGWREFSYHLLHANPQLKTTPLQKKFSHFQWLNEPRHLRAWQTGQTGYPIIDAGMRELYQTGYMHNRVRMIVGSFLVKNLLLDWRHGEAWFWDCLFDADAASNTASWQWIAGCGADAAPYFRVFNPITQGHKFDSDGKYTRHFVPELADMPSKYLFNPFDAPADVLQRAGVSLGKSYPYPLVDVKVSRLRALEHFAALPKGTSSDM